ncbi:MAG TPA: ice-binding family protein, partial [Pyrinomonadaceae bacterium]|nr:ice-binding family protein [Pyrinomonadaceae bacterium]
ALAQSVPPLGNAQSFAALAGTTLTATGAGTVISGNVGVSPGTAVTGFPPAVVQNGAIYTGVGSLAGPAQASALIAYNNLKGQACPSANNLTGKILGQTPGFLSLSPGVYCFDTSAQLNAILTLNDGGDPNAIFIFQIGTTLTTASSSQVLMSSGGRGTNVYWQVGTSATIGTSTTFRGNIIANTSITFTTSASTTGRVFALNGATTIDTIILDAVPTPSPTPTPTPATIQFSAPLYTVGEGDKRVNLTVTRTGDTSGPASVGFATNDAAGLTNCNVFNGTASPRCDYEVTIGTVQFLVGETSRSFSVAIVDDSYAEGTENFTVSLNNPLPLGATLGTQSTTTVMIVDNETTTGPNPIDGTDFFVRQQYLDFLGREPDPPGFAGWTSTINNCSGDTTQCDRIHVSQLFFQSEEFQTRGYFVYRLYPVSFGRKPDYAEFIVDLARVSGFLDPTQLEAAKVLVIADFMARTAFVTKYNSLDNTTYVDTLLSTAGVTLSSRQALIDGLTNSTLTRAAVLRQIVESAEVSTKYNHQAYAVMEYFGYLRRQPDAFYLDWIQVLDQSNNPRGMVTGFVNSAEYRQRFGP